ADQDRRFLRHVLLLEQREHLARERLEGATGNKGGGAVGLATGQRDRRRDRCRRQQRADPCTAQRRTPPAGGCPRAGLEESLSLRCGLSKAKFSRLALEHGGGKLMVNIRPKLLQH